MCQDLRKLELAMLLFIIVLIIIPGLYSYHVFKHPEEPEARISFYTQEYYWVTITDSEKKIDSRTKIFYLESKKVPEHKFEFHLDLSKTDFISYEIQETWIKVRKEKEELDFEDKFENKILSVILTIPEYYVNSGEQIIIGYKILIKAKNLFPDEKFCLPLEIPRNIIQLENKIAVIGITLPKTYQVIDVEPHVTNKEKRNIRTILFPPLKKSKDLISHSLLFIEHRESAEPDEKTIFYFYVESSEEEYSFQKTWLYDSIEIQVKILEKKYWINIRTHVSYMGDEQIDFVLDPLKYFIYFPKKVEILRYKLQNGSILSSGEESVTNHGKLAVLRRKDNLPIFKPGENIWIEIEAISPHNIDFEGKKIFNMSFPVVIMDDIHVKYKLELPISATQVFMGFPENYLVKDEKILEWNYENLEMGDICFFATSFLNNVKLPSNIWIDNVIFVIAFFIIWVVFLFASYFWYQKRMTLLFSGVSLFLSYFSIFLEIINPSDLKFLPDFGERVGMSILWTYLFVFSFVSILIWIFRIFLKRKQIELTGDLRINN